MGATASLWEERAKTLGAALLAVVACIAVLMAATCFFDAQQAFALGDSLQPAQSDDGTDDDAAAKQALSPGVYAVPVALMKANDHARPSGAAGAFANEARLSVASDGVATLCVEVKPVEFGSLTGYASDYRVHSADSAKSDSNPVTVESWLTDEAGSRVEDSAGNSVPAEIKFQIPDMSWGGVYISMYVDAMGATPDAWLRIDYGSAVPYGEPVVYSGVAHVEQFGGYDVNVRVAVQGGTILGVEIEGANFSGSDADVNETMLARAADGMKDKWNGMWIGHGHSEAERLYKAGGEALDTVSGATYTSEVIRDAVMNALGISWDDEQITVPSSLPAGTYNVNVSYYTDIVLHQLAGQRQARATLVVKADGSMQLDIDLVNGTTREPLYVTAVNGYYVGNDVSKGLSTAGMAVAMGETGYSDLYFPKGTQVATHLSAPLVGGLAEEYATQVHMYVPVMNALVGEQNGIMFDHGSFDVNAYLKIHWDSRNLVSGLTDPSAEQGQQGAPASKMVSVTLNDKTVNAKTVAKAIAAAGGKVADVKTIILDKKVKRIAKRAFAGTGATKLVVKTKKLAKKSVKGCLKGSKVKVVQVKAGGKKVSKKLAKKYGKVFAKKVVGKKVKVKA